ncbi:hypothetical protein VPH35_007142 [Triticum aestivum]
MAPRSKGLASLRPDPISASLASDQACTTRCHHRHHREAWIHACSGCGFVSSRSPLRSSVPIWFALSPALMRPVLHTQVHKRPRLHSKAICAGVDWRAHTRWLDGGDTDLLRRVSQEAVHPAATTSTARRWWPTCNATAASPVTSSQWQHKQEPRLLLV